jgi:NADPH2:quinone reductase
VRRLTGGDGVDVVYDSVGKDTVHRSIRCLKRRGTFVMFGTSSGQVDGIAPLELAEAGSVFFTRPHLADYMQAAEVRQRAGDLFALVASGRLRVAIDRSFDLDCAADARRYIEGRKTQGKLLLNVSR